MFDFREVLLEVHMEFCMGISGLGDRARCLSRCAPHLNQQIQMLEQGFLTCPGAEHTEVITALLDRLDAAGEAARTTHTGAHQAQCR